MARRTKREMELMNGDVRYYLLQTNNDYHKAHELMIKEYLESHQPIPYYIKGVKDFIKVSQELALELNRKEQMAKRDKEQYDRKQEIINYIMSLSTNEMKAIYKEYKDIVRNSDKLVLHMVYMAIYNNDLKEKDIDQHTINVFTEIYQDKQLQTA